MKKIRHRHKTRKCDIVIKDKHRFSQTPLTESFAFYFTDSILLERATLDILPTYATKGLYLFKAKWLFIATWHNVTYFGGNSTSPVRNKNKLYSLKGLSATLQNTQGPNLTQLDLFNNSAI